ncbi:MAG TPA: SDR family oxidoreductase [Paracoccaceae bacterium]|nr:SDR family oxidoreductase [Paracoccaceae bacterium]
MERTLILGAGSGIGAATARRIAQPGIGLLLHTGRSRERLDAVADECRGAGAEVETCIGDMAEAESFAPIARWLNSIPTGALTGVVFAAGYARLGTVSEAPADEVAEALNAMPLAFHRLVALTAPKLGDGRGRIVCVGAFGAHLAKSYSYAATAPAKAALEGQVRVFAANLAPRGITVNAIVPGFIRKEAGTPSSLTPEQWAEVTAGIAMQRLGRADEVASAIEYLLSPDAGYITGQALHVNGGLTL